MSKRCAWALALVVGLAAVSPAGAVTDEEVQQAIRKGVQALYNLQEAWGHWDEKDPGGPGHAGVQHGGTTSLACYALLSCGEEWQKNPNLLKALQWLQKVETQGTYAVGLRAHVWAKLPDNFLKFVERDAGLLKDGLNPSGGYRYKLGDSAIDNSCTQYGVLGAWECAKRMPGSITNDYWQQVEGWLTRSQNADGGWGYNQNSNSTFNMTAAGLAMSYITQDYLHARTFSRPGVAESHPSQQRINRGLEWYDKNFKPSIGDGYGLVGVERVGLASGRKYFGNQDWYQTIASQLVAKQAANGSFSGGRGPVVNTAFCLVFLSRGRVPVAFNKLEIPDFPWDNRPNDLAKFTAWLSDEAEQNMNWQVVGIGRNPTEWLDAPVLYLATHKPLELSDEQVARLKRYIDLGGLLLTHADGSTPAVTKSVQELAGKMYPQYEMKVLDGDDYIYNINYPIRRPMGLMSVSNGIRHLIIHSPRDLAEAFQTENVRQTDNWYVMANIFHYATEVGHSRPRLAQHFIKKEKTGSKPVAIARIRYDGNWNPEPGAWMVQRNFMANQKDVEAEVVALDLARLGDAPANMAHVVGTAAVEWTDEQIAAIKQYVASGGVIVFESGGGTQQTLPFVESVKKMLAAAYPDKRLEGITTGATVINGAGIDGFDNSRVDYRVFYKQRVGPTRQPMLMGMMFDGQPRIIISHEDLTEAMLGQPVWGVFGYDSASAHKIMTNIALWAAKIHPVEGDLAEAAAAAAEGQGEGAAGGAEANGATEGKGAAE